MSSTIRPTTQIGGLRALAPRFEPSQRAWVLSGFLTLVQPAVRASVPQDADLRGRLSALMPFCSTCQITMTIPADPAAIPIVTDGVGEMLEARQWPTEDVLGVQLALQEAVANAIRHGCRGDVSKHVQCSVSCDESGDVVMVVRDPGPGFDPSAIADPLDAANILRPSGRGLFLITKLMDDVQFADGGREVQMRKRKALERMPAAR
jgi:serine/threonine-protein kinase RsbW